MIYVHLGYCAIRVGRYWIGMAEGNRSAIKRRISPERAIYDAKKLDRRRDDIRQP